ncbi:electron transfer flavoprotein subunit alpha/FixB family protein [Lactobacillus sp. XV13L]|nr:electron transfer flavoprotein subunit alpha/FixB family protein [Lactobacillus sp. XV13L]
MTPIYYIQLEDENIAEGNSVNTLAGLDGNFSGPKEVLVFSNHADQIKGKYAQSGIKTTIFNSQNYVLTDFADVLSTLRNLFADKEKYLLIFDQDNLGNSMGSRLAAQLDATFVADAQNVCQNDERLTVDKSIGETRAFRRITLGAKAVISVSCNGVLGNKKADVEVVDWSIKHETNGSYVPERNAGNDLAYAKVVVAGGKGLGSPDKFNALQALAGKLNASLGATKAVTDQGWADASRMIGISNLKIAPDVYYAFGISGAVQHTIGMNKSKCVIAVNTDRSAPIFKLADYGIVGDANLVIKQLNNLL